jgi:hypothetical protein
MSCHDTAYFDPLEAVAAALAEEFGRPPTDMEVIAEAIWLGAPWESREDLRVAEELDAPPAVIAAIADWLEAAGDWA